MQRNAIKNLVYGIEERQQNQKNINQRDQVGAQLERSHLTHGSGIVVVLF